MLENGSEYPSVGKFKVVQAKELQLRTRARPRHAAYLISSRISPVRRYRASVGGPALSQLPTHTLLTFPSFFSPLLPLHHARTSQRRVGPLLDRDTRAELGITFVTFQEKRTS